MGRGRGHFGHSNRHNHHHHHFGSSGRRGGGTYMDWDMMSQTIYPPMILNGKYSHMGS